MSTIVLVKNALKPNESQRFAVERDVLLIDWLQENYPNGFGAAININVNGIPVTVEESDVMISGDDVVVITAKPNGPLAPIFVNFLISTAISLVVGMIFGKKANAPSAQRITTPAADPVYSVGSSQNTARLGEPIPIIYGQVITTPDLASQPYTYYEGNEQYLMQILCIGAGNFKVDEVLVGETPADQLAAGLFQYWVVPEAQHQRTAGKVFTITGVQENVITSPEVSDHEISAAGATTAGWFMANPPRTKIDRVSCDFVLPAGLYNMNATNGALGGNSVQLQIWYEQVDDAGVPSGIIGQHQFTISAGTNTPQRWTESIDVTAARYRVRVMFLSAVSTSTYNVNTTHWTALKGRCPDSTDKVYGPVTLLVTKTKASNGISNDASGRVRVKVTRLLTDLGTGAERATQSPADAYFDILSNKDYGGRLAVDSIDTAELAKLRTHWGVDGRFDAAFSSKSTVYEAIDASLQTVLASPISTGHIMSAAQEGEKLTREAMFTDMNIMRGSMKVNYSFDRVGDYDGVEVKYRNPDTFNPDFVRYPASAVNPDAIDLFGCTSKDLAEKYARYEFQRRGLIRKYIEFETELEGFIPRIGSRIAVVSQLPRWGHSGIVLDNKWPAIKLDGQQDWSGTGHVIMLRSPDGTPSAPMPCVRQSIPDNQYVVISGFPTPPVTMSTGERQEPTHYAFGTASKVVADFIVQKVEHVSGVRVRITASTYNPAVFANSFNFLSVPI